MLRFILAVAAIGVTVYAAIDCMRSPAEQLRTLPKVVWLLVIAVTLPIGALGGIGYLVFGRPHPEPGMGPGGGGQIHRGPAPDDDPDFLRSLDQHPDEGENRKR
jgi:Phospholipase_D-nuclease N-terminal